MGPVISQFGQQRFEGIGTDGIVEQRRTHVAQRQAGCEQINAVSRMRFASGKSIFGGYRKATLQRGRSIKGIRSCGKGVSPSPEPRRASMPGTS